MGQKWAEVVARSRDRIVDLLLALAILAFTIPPASTGGFLALVVAPAPIRVLVALATAVAVLARRRTAWPLMAGAVACAALAGSLVPLTLAAYSMTARGTVRRWQRAAAGLAVVYVIAESAGRYTGGQVVISAVRALTLVYAPALVGTWARDHREMMTRLWREVRTREEQAASAERRRLAGELHDSVTHAVTVMVLNAGMIQDTDDPDEIRAMAGTIEDKGVRALTELRELLTSLRRRDLPPSAEGCQGIPRLVRESRDAGLKVDLCYDLGDREPPRDVGHACFRVVQEGLSNVCKHARKSDVRVRCLMRDEEVEVSVVNSAVDGAVDGHVEGPCYRRPGREREPGYGLAGLRERVSALGGRLTCGPTDEGGFALSAVIPLSATVPPPETEH
ncbi:hypothetical protein JOL79_18690 [Microbispora sp. RL4-1S]|uniref:histidine kinase n=1 Tax=Microbispora oryzae TaxID=2806554 RepID=A0A940WHX2_9ACTN|nr:histidine kinase [Microbispora oryzae]MBP2705841.1 hypothetical protein [Microbispora oryzae]